tara:strand:- start:21580 stop:21921 length:342 start_codon:yes stop_codon:yes gene_type:complete
MTQYKLGDRVSYKIWGDGTIIEYCNNNNSFFIEFDNINDKLHNGNRITDNKTVYIVYECAEMRHQRTLNAIILAGGRIHAVKDNKEAAELLKEKLDCETKNYIAILTFDTESK